ncbi:MAG: nucleotidyltransferase [Clostridiales bacterium]|nr:nucleotidyltransferase [Clostridiales bacterium]
MKTALVILAAGIGARYGGGIKQLEPVGPMGEIIVDYSIHDAIAAGFNKIVFIIRRDIEADFREVIGDRMEATCRELGVEVAYAYQSLEDVPQGMTVPRDRVKPWGTGQALLSCREVLHEPFAVINADDYYGKEAFGRLYAFLQRYRPECPGAFCMAGFILSNTLSEHGGVTRGICHVNREGYLERVVETKNVVKVPGGAAVAQADGSLRPLDPDCYVSMNMWGMTPEILTELDRGFRAFCQRPDLDPKTSEFLIPIFVDQLLQEGRVTVKVLPSADKWFGVTYRADKPLVDRAFRELIAAGAYRTDLFSDLRDTWMI